MNHIQQMFKLQQQLNDDTNGENWQSGITKDGREISWYRCIYMEAAEAIDSFNWKHWKDIDKQPDWANVKLELVDIWHFIMSEVISSGNVEYYDKYLELKVNNKIDTHMLIANLENIITLAAESSFNKSQNNIERITDIFFATVAGIGIDIVDLYKRYTIKNQLNIFRQNNGYKDGRYIKIWDAVEDNVIAFNIMEEDPSLTPDELYKKLEEEYQHIK